MSFKKRSSWSYDGSSGGSLGISMVTLDKGTVRLKRADAKANVMERTSLYYSAAGISVDIGLPVGLSFSTEDQPDVGKIYVADKIKGDLKSSDFEGLCFIHSGSANFFMGGSYSLLFFGIPWRKLSKQVVQGIALGVMEMGLGGPLYALYKGLKFAFGNGGTVPPEFRALAGEAKGAIIMAGQTVGPSVGIGVSSQFGYMSSDPSFVPWKMHMPVHQDHIDMGVKNVSRDETILLVPGDVLFGFDRDEVGSGTGGKVKADLALSWISFVVGMTRPRTLFIEGHTDLVGRPKYNLDLSERRASAVKNWFSGKPTIAGVNVSTNGYGEDRPIVKTEGKSEVNRRVEFRLLG